MASALEMGKKNIKYSIFKPNGMDANDMIFEKCVECVIQYKEVSV